MSKVESVEEAIKRGVVVQHVSEDASAGKLAMSRVRNHQRLRRANQQAKRLLGPQRRRSR